MPKCGGSSLAESLYGCVPIDRRIGVLDALATRRAAALRHFDHDDPHLCHEDLEHGHLTFDLREDQLLTHLSWGTWLIHGHVLYSERAFELAGHAYGLITLLRDPKARAVSNYRMAVRAGVIPDDVDAWLSGPVGKSMAQVYLRYLSGRNVVAAGEVAAMRDLAMARLKRFDVIGLLDDLPGFGADLKSAFNISPPIGRLNRGTGRDVTLSRDQRARLTALLQPDLEIYDRARQLVAASRTLPGSRCQILSAARTPAKAGRV